MFPAPAHGCFLPTCHHYPTDPHIYMFTRAIFLASKSALVSSLLTILNDSLQFTGILRGWPARNWPLGIWSSSFVTLPKTPSPKHIFYIQECNCSLPCTSPLSSRQIPIDFLDSALPHLPWEAFLHLLLLPRGVLLCALWATFANLQPNTIN